MLSATSYGRALAENRRLKNAQDGNQQLEFNKVNLKKFQRKYLESDGYVMLHIIKSVAGDIVFMELLYEIWLDFVNNERNTNGEHQK